MRVTILQRTRLAAVLLTAALLGTFGRAADSDRDFSGKWLFNADHSDLRGLPGEAYPTLVIEQKADIRCTATTASGTSIQWTFRLDGEDSKYKIGAEGRNSEVKWEGAALLVNTLVSGPESYTIMERWTLSRDHSQLNIWREIDSGPKHSEGTLIYRREGAPTSSTATAMGAPSGTTPAAPTTLVRRPEPPMPPPPAQYIIPAGTHILLTLTNPVSTKNSKDGDHIYLETAVPVAKDSRIVIPRGSYVQGSVSKTKPAGRGSSKGELYIRFDSLTLPNGVSRDFHARPTSSDSANVDADEGKISGSGKGTDTGKVVRDVGIGSMGGVLIGSAAGHPITGLGVGAAAGVAAVLLSKNKDVVLPRGTSVEMVLDRDLYYTAEEMRH
jgi:hypothetical protein